MLSIEIQRRYKRLCVTHLACQRLQEAVTEIKKTAHVDPVLAADGLVTLPEGIWPAFQHIHASSGALGGAVGWTQSELLPLLIDAPADRSMRGKWLKRQAGDRGRWCRLSLDGAGTLGGAVRFARTASQ